MERDKEELNQEEQKQVIAYMWGKEDGCLCEAPEDQDWACMVKCIKCGNRWRPDELNYRHPSLNKPDGFFWLVERLNEHKDLLEYLESTCTVIDSVVGESPVRLIITNPIGKPKPYLFARRIWSFILTITPVEKEKGENEECLHLSHEFGHKKCLSCGVKLNPKTGKPQKGKPHEV